jgi:hypothetical protein
LVSKSIQGNVKLFGKNYNKIACGAIGENEFKKISLICSLIRTKAPLPNHEIKKLSA